MELVEAKSEVLEAANAEERAAANGLVVGG